MKVNEYFELVEDSDLNSENVRSIILACPDCGALFSSKNIPGRTIFPWFGFHPDDGNLRVVPDDVAQKIETNAFECDRLGHKNCDRVKTVKQLRELIEAVE